MANFGRTYAIEFLFWRHLQVKLSFFVNPHQTSDLPWFLTFLPKKTKLGGITPHQLLWNLPPLFRWVLQKSSQVAFKIYPPKVLINKMTALKNYTYVKIKQYEPAKSSMNKNLSCEWKKRLDHWSCFCSQVQFSIWCCILKQLTKWLNFERTQYCLISNTSVFLENSCKPDPPGGALFYGNSTKFSFFNYHINSLKNR